MKQANKKYLNYLVDYYHQKKTDKENVGFFVKDEKWLSSMSQYIDSEKDRRIEVFDEYFSKHDKK